MDEVLLKNGLLILPGNSTRADILLEDGKIKEIGTSLHHDLAHIIDAGGKWVLPGAIDPHVHLDLPTPAGNSCDGFDNAATLALAGGTTYLMDFVTPAQGQSLVDACKLRQAEAKTCGIPVGLHVGITWYGPSIAQQMEICCKELGINSFKVYLAYKGSIGIGVQELKEVMNVAAKLDAVVLVHCEQGDEIADRQQKLLLQGISGPAAHALSRPACTETGSVKTVLALCAATRCKTYIVHTSTRGSMDLIREAKKAGLPVFCETCMQYLLLDESKYQLPQPEGLKYVMSPPLRSMADCEALWEALADGTADTLATDHCPFDTRGQKDRFPMDFTRIPNGAGGLEHRLGLLYTYGVKSGKISPSQWVGLTSANAARIFKLFPAKGSLNAGADADLLLWDPQPTHTISASQHFSRCDSDIFEGMEVSGSATVLLSGKVVAP